MQSLGVVLLSGGLDSCVVAALARRRAVQLQALTLRYGQRHARELDAARAVASALAIPQREADVSFFGALAWYSSLTTPERFPLPQDRPLEAAGTAIPSTYVPLRNTFFIALAAALVESAALEAIEQHGASPAELRAAVYIAANAIDYSGYPDCRPEYYAQVSETLCRGSKIGTEYGVPIRVETPILALGKAEIVRLGVELAAPLELTWSCYAGGARPCGRCDSCRLRAEGFAAAGLPDPALR